MISVYQENCLTFITAYNLLSRYDVLKILFLRHYVLPENAVSSHTTNKSKS